jgi:thioredoxin-like negative regulator of GroEL
VGEDILRDHPGYPPIKVNLARVYIDSQDRARGLNLLIAALEQGPIRVEDWELLLEALGVIGKQPGRPEVVVSKLREKIADNPDRPSLRYLLMVVLTRYGRYAEARELLVADPGLADHPELKVFAAHTAEAASP